jgi:EmrB/QacA subfamily drug resistance transporter
MRDVGGGDDVVDGHLVEAPLVEHGHGDGLELRAGLLLLAVAEARVIGAGCRGDASILPIARAKWHVCQMAHLKSGMSAISLVPMETTAPARLQDPRVHQRRWYTLGVLCLSLLIVTIGNSSLNVAIPTLSQELGATSSQLQWVVAIYSLVFAGLLFTTGALGDRYGRKGALQAGLVFFLAGAALATASDTMWQLIACRAVMGIGGALIMPSTLSILVNVFPAEERAKAIAIWAGIAGAAGALGPVASGWLLGHFWYGSVFLVNVPIIAVALVAGHFLVPRSKDPEQGQIDPIGALLSIVGIGGLVYALIQAPEDGWTSATTLVTFAAALIVLALFVAWELHVDEPMLDMRYFRNAAFSTGTGGMILVFLSMFGVMFLVTQYFQLILGYTPLSTAVRFLPMSPIMIVIAPLTPRLSARYGANRTVAGGMGLIAIGLLMFRGLDLGTSYWYVLACVFLFVSGLALTMSPMTAAIMSAVPTRRAGAGSAMNDATRELGASLGVAVLGSIAASQFSSRIAELTQGLPAAAREVAESSLAGALQTASTLPGEAGAALASGANAAFLDGFHLAVLVGAILASVAAVLVYRYLPRGAGVATPHDAAEAIEITAELGVAGVEPVYAEAVAGN